MRNTLRIFIATVLFSASASAAPSITVNSVVQRWPWNNLVDINYTVSGGQDKACGVYCNVTFTANINGRSYPVTAYADASDGTHTATWKVPEGIVAEGCTIDATIAASAIPSGNEYMIVDLETGMTTYEGMASQDAANARYNTGEYKTSKMVFRKVPKTAESDYPNGYRTGHPDFYDTPYNCRNAPYDWKTTKDFYIGVFMVTQKQYEKICGTGSNPSVFTKANTKVAGDVIEYRPVDSVTWSGLRGEASLPTNTVVPNASGSFLERFNHITQIGAGITGFDLPTEVMFEIAQRAGSTNKYVWGDAPSTLYAVSKQNSGAANDNNLGTTLAVGTLLSNSWGLYDTTGNIYEWCRDDADRYSLSQVTDPFKPNWNPNQSAADIDNRYIRGGGVLINNYTDTQFTPSFRKNSALYKNKDNPTDGKYIGFRVAYIVQ